MLKFLLLFFIAIYVFGYIGKWLLSRWIRKVAGGQMDQNAYQQKKEGEVTVKPNAKNNSKNNTTEGEYVDYEEVND